MKVLSQTNLAQVAKRRRRYTLHSQAKGHVLLVTEPGRGYDIGTGGTACPHSVAQDEPYLVTSGWGPRLKGAD